MGFIVEGVLYITVTSYLVYEGRLRYQLCSAIYIPSGSGGSRCCRRCSGSWPEAVCVGVAAPHKVRGVVGPVRRLRDCVVASIGHHRSGHKVTGRGGGPRGKS